MSKKEFEYVIIGAGIAGCSTAHFLSKYSSSVLLIDRHKDIALGASYAAGAFLSPLLGKANAFKDLVTDSLKFSVQFYKELSSSCINNCGVNRIPKNNKDKEKFETYIPFMDFDFQTLEQGYFFEIGSQVKPQEVCEVLTKNVQKEFNKNVKKLTQLEDDSWLIDDEIIAKNLILTMGANVKLIEELYFNIRAVWGAKIDITSTTCTTINYHKECSVSASIKDEENERYKLSIGATHHRFECDKAICEYFIDYEDLNNPCSKCYTKELCNSDTQKLLNLANDIVKLEDVKVEDIKVGARACSVDYFPMVGELVDSKTTIEKNPHFVNGSFVSSDKLTKIKNLFVLNGVGGRGFVLSPYLANELVESIINNKKLDENIVADRLFKRWVKKSKLTHS